MNIVFAGTPAFSVPVLQVLLDSPHTVVAVYSQPDRPAGRGRKPLASPVKQLAQGAGIPVFQPLSLKDTATQEELASRSADLMVVVAYGLILPQAVLDMPRLGCVNVHASLLPRWRGAAPVQRAIQAGDAKTGVCLMQMEAGLDTGPVLATAECDIAPDDTGSSLHDRLSLLGAKLLEDSLPAIEAGRLEAVAQDDAGACYAHRLEKKEAQIDWCLDAGTIERQVRAFNAWPVAETRFDGKQLRIWEAQVVDQQASVLPGTVVASGREGIDVACGEGVLRLVRVQSPGRQAVAAADFANAHALEGAVLGSH